MRYINGRVFLISVALGSAIVGVVGPISWQYFSVQAYKEKLAAREAAEEKERDLKHKATRESIKWEYKEYASEIRYLEKLARAGVTDLYEETQYHYSGKGTSPLEVLRSEDYGARMLDDDDVLERYRSWAYPKLPKDQFHAWGHDPFGQEKIDAAQKVIDSASD
jgi:hypothetical protein